LRTSLGTVSLEDAPRSKGCGPASNYANRAGSGRFPVKEYCDSGEKGRVFWRSLTAKRPATHAWRLQVSGVGTAHPRS